MHTPVNDAPNTNDSSNTDPSTEESIKQGKEIIKVQQDENPAPKKEKEEDAEKWRNEG